MATDKKKQITVFFNFGVQIGVDAGTTLLELSREYSSFYKSAIIAARMNNTIKELNYKLDEDCKVDFVDLTDEDGCRIYRRSLHFILVKAVNDLYPDRKVVINHSISKGIYCEVTGGSELRQDEVAAIEQRMRELVGRCIPFRKRV
ncbi:MAG: nucleoside kinase, partial [Ruminiclostridium sp.]|nr:nucleoside kinase [Ruminiclostridium sp.]